MRPGWDEYFIEICKVVASRSHDEETKVGCVVVDHKKRIVSTGYNGFPPGFDDDKYPKTRPDKYPYMVHAEMNAIASCKGDLSGCTLYCTHEPCNDCTKAIITAGITKVFYCINRTDHIHTIDLFKEVDIKVCKLDYHIDS